jgi:hypothetical protein
MRSVSIRSTRKTPAPSQRGGSQEQRPPAMPLSPRDDLHILIEKRAYELYGERGYRSGGELDDWLDAEREILAQVPPISQAHDS